MIEFFTVSLAFLATPWVALLLFCLGVGFSHFEWDWTVGFITTALFAVVFFTFGTQWGILGITLFIPFGIIYSIYRWKREIRRAWEEVLERAKDVNGSHFVTDPYTRKQTQETPELYIERKREYFKEKYSAANCITDIMFWVFTWPFSLIANLLGDIIDSTARFVKTKLAFYYAKVVDDITNSN